MKPHLFILLIATAFNIYSQNVINFETSPYVSDFFSRGDSSNFIISQDQKLQLNASQSGQSYLVRSHSLNALQFKEWQLNITLSFSPSSNNFARYYINTNDSILVENSDGLYLQFGESGSNDAVRLIHKVNGQTTEILTGLNAQINSSFSYSFRIRVDSSDNWDISYFNTINSDWELMDSAVYNNVSAFPYMGLLCKYTSSNINDFVFDDLVYGNIPIDTVGPQLLTIETLTANKLLVNLNEGINSDSLNLLKVKNEGLLIDTDSTYLDTINPNQLYIVLSNKLRNLSNLNLTLHNLYDDLGNKSSIEINRNVLYSEPSEYSDIVFSEVMIDPIPSMGLPEVEYVEIYNKSDKVFQLSDFILVDEVDTNFLPDKWIYPREYLLLCDETDTAGFINSLGVSNFINLNNTEDHLKILYRNGKLIDHLSYGTVYLDKPLAAKDGRSLSLKNINFRCKDEQNWWASTEEVGGSPGIENTGIDYFLDTVKPKLEFYSFPSSNQVNLFFNKQMDSTFLDIDDVALSFNNMSFFEYSSNSLLLNFEHEISESKEINLVIHELRDCNLTKTTINTQLIKPSEIDFGDIIISEVLFNPITGGEDYLEIYNRSNKYFNLKKVQISKGEDTVAIGKNYLFAPNTLCYFSKDVTWLKQHYPFSGDTNYIEIDLPNFPNDSSRIVISENGNLLDELNYNENMHFNILENFEGKSLERINNDRNGKAIFRTAASNVDFGTPGTENSQKVQFIGGAICSVNPKIITPNSDGMNDFTTIYYSQLSKQALLNVRVYDENGLFVKHLLNNHLNSNKASVYWDGTDENNQVLRVGNYIVLSEILDLEKNELQVIKVLVILNGK